MSAPEPVNLLAALDASVSAAKASAAPDPTLGLPDLSDAEHAPDGTLLGRTVWGLASSDRLAICGMGRVGRYYADKDDHLIRHGYAVEYAPGFKALTDLGAHLAWHAYDGERGLHVPMHEGWVTNAEARRRRLPTYRAPLVLWWDGTQIAIWVHPLVCEDGYGACTPVRTDCCEEPRPMCETATEYDTDGTVLVTACRLGMGCQR